MGVESEAPGAASAVLGVSPMFHVEYLIKWRGWSAEQATWEPLRNLSGCPALLRAYHRSALTEELGEKEVRAVAQLAALEAYIVRCGGTEDMLSGWDVRWFDVAHVVSENRGMLEQVQGGSAHSPVAITSDTVMLDMLPGSFCSPNGITFRSPFEVRRMHMHFVPIDPVNCKSHCACVNHPASLSRFAAICS